MPSLIPGYEYDIFISYRQKDNKHDGWVTEFVNQLKGELEATFKEDISIYFDENPSDGLLETHSVDKSLEGKLKCLILIPIISQTYCDSKSFAWQHELCAFNKLAKEDQFGMDVRLSSGNVASRILPVKIHDLDPEDESLLETELSGVLRSIEFIYNSPGVNRPLNPSDNPDKNLNKTYYRDQINKIANAIKEIISALKNQCQHPDEVPKENYKEKPVHQKNLKTKIIAVSLILLTLILAGYFFVPKLFKPSKQVEKSIAVLPFENLSSDKDQVWFSDGITDVIISQLSKISDLRVLGRTSTLKYKEGKKSISEIGKELGVNFIIEGTVQRQGDKMRITVQLIRGINEGHIWSDIYDREWKDIFDVQSDIAQRIVEKLKTVLTPEEKQKIEKKPTENLEAYSYYLQGNFNYWKVPDSGDVGKAIELYNKAIALDPEFALAYTGIAICLLDQYWFYKDHSENVLLNSKKAIDKAFEIDPDLPEAHLALGDYYYCGYLDYSKALKQYEIVLKDQPMNFLAVYWSASAYRRAGNWEMAKTDFEKALKLDPQRSEIAEEVGETLDLLREYAKAEEYYNMSIMLQPDWVYPYLFLSRMIPRWDGNTKKSREILSVAARGNRSSISDSLVIETNVLNDIYDRNYEEALKEISHLKCNVLQGQAYFRPKYLYYATIYGLMNKPELEHAYYDSARIFLESKIINMTNDQRLYGSLGIVYAGLGYNEKAINAGEKATKLLPVSKEAYRGVYPIEDLALIYVMTGKYDKALEQIEYLLSIPGFLSTKILEIDPRWAPLKNQLGFKKIIEKYTVK
jgi:TolB-like protein